MKNKPGLFRVWFMRLFGKDVILSDSFVGISSFHADGSIDAIYQRMDGSYYWKKIFCCTGVNERKALDENTDDITVRSENSAPAKALLDDRS